MLNKAEGIYYQIKEADHLTNQVRLIIGLPVEGATNSLDCEDDTSPLNTSNELNTEHQLCSLEAVTLGSDSEVSFETALSNNYL